MISFFGRAETAAGDLARNKICAPFGYLETPGSCIEQRSQGKIMEIKNAWFFGVGPFSFVCA